MRLTDLSGLPRFVRYHYCLEKDQHGTPSVMVRGHQQHCDTWADTFRYVALYASMCADLDLTCIIWLQMDTISHYPLIHF